MKSMVAEEEGVSNMSDIVQKGYLPSSPNLEPSKRRWDSNLSVDFAKQYKRAAR